MAVDPKLIKERLAKLQQSGGGEKKDWTKISWKPKLGKQVVRLVESSYYSEYPELFPAGPLFMEVEVHNYNAFKRKLFALTTFGEKDPIQETKKKLYATKDEDDEKIAKKIGTSKKIFAMVVVRGEEEMGPRIWEFGNQTYEKLLNIMADEDYGDISDITDGSDITVEGYEDSIPSTKKKYINVNITPRRKTSPLSDDADQVEEWLTNQPDPMQMYSKLSYKELKELLVKFLSPEDDEDTEDDDVEDTKSVKKEPVKSVSKKSVKKQEEDEDDEEDGEEDTKPVKKAASKKVVTLDEDDEDEEFEEDEDDEKPVKKTATKSPSATKKEVSKTVEKVVSKKAATSTTNSSKKKFEEMFPDDED